MSVVSVVIRLLLLALIGLGSGGCREGPNNESDEQKDPCYLRGKSLAASLDYAGAAAAFEKALEENPRNASAHFELCWLDEQKLNDYAAAIYHGERYLRLRPNSEFAEIVRQHLDACRRELAKSVPVGPLIPALQHDFERLTATSKALLQQVEVLSRQLALATNRPPTPPPAAPAPSAPSATLAANQETKPAPRPAPRALPTAAASTPTPASSPARIHYVRRGETLARISREYGISLASLQTANPGIEPRRLRAGQALKVPGR